LGALVVDEQVRLQRQDLVAHHDDVVARSDALATGVQHLEADVELSIGGPDIQPVADELRVRIGLEVVAHRGRGADEGDAHRVRLALERHGRPTETVIVGREPVRRRGVGQEAVGRPLLRLALAIGRRVVDEEMAGRAAEIAVAAGVAHECGVPCLEHVLPARALGDAAGLDVAHQSPPSLRYRPFVRQRRGCLVEPGPIDACRRGDFVEMPGRWPDVVVGILPSRHHLGCAGYEHHGGHHQEAVQHAFLHGRVTTRFFDSRRMKRKLAP
jgi:hypothetical protein